MAIKGFLSLCLKISSKLSKANLIALAFPTFKANEITWVENNGQGQKVGKAV